jgi:hypothetical protein
VKRRYRLAGSGHAPARPHEAKRQSDLIPVRDEAHFDWRVGELLLGPEPKRDLTAILRDCWPVGGPSGRWK